MSNTIYFEKINIAEVEKYINTIVETKEFEQSYTQFKDEISLSLADGIITLEELKNISVKMFALVHALQHLKFKFDGSTKTKLKTALTNYLTDILTNLIIHALNKVIEEFPTVKTLVTVDQIHYLVSALVSTAELSIELSTGTCCFF